MIRQGISQKHVADTLGCSRCAVQGLLDHHKGKTYVSCLPSFCRPRCTTITVRQVWQLVRHCLGRRTWTMCVVDLDTNNIAGFYVGAPRMKRCWPNVTVLCYNWDSTELYVVFIQRQVQIQCVQHQWSRRLFWEIQENRGTKRGGVTVWGAMYQSYVGLLHMTHDLWLTEWSRLHGYPIYDSVGLFSPYARLWGQLLHPGRQCSLLQSCYCQRMEGTAWRPYTAPKVLT